MDTTPSWTLEFSRAFKKVSELYAFLDWPLPEALQRVEEKYPVFIPRRLAQKIKAQGPDGVLAREFLPQFDELSDGGFADPIGDHAYQKAPQLIHRYHNRVLFTPTSVCPVQCRYCFRKNELSMSDELFQQDFLTTLAYLRAHPEITELIFTGGDPLALSNERLGRYLDELSKIESLRDIRFHTRFPVILPERLDAGFFELLRTFGERFRTLTVAVHANHVSEFDAQVDAVVKRLAALPVQVLSQTVLLKGVNDDPESLLALVDHFVSLKVRPYYLHHPDQVKGGMHFSLPLNRGREIYGKLRARLPGWALPHYVIDIPGGEGKVQAYNPESHDYSGFFLNQQGQQIAVAEPEHFTKLS